MGCCSFCFAWILWISKRADSNSPCPAAWRISSGAPKITLQRTLRSKAVIVGLIFNTWQETISVSHIVMFAEKTYNAFEPVGHTKRGKERES